jgi:predicted enzyme related to lactoylglutathione lyase
VKELIMATTAVQSNAVGWFELYVDDLARAKTFYQAVFQRPMEDLATPPGGDMQMCMFSMNEEGSGAAGALVKSPHTKPGSGGTLVYFSCADCAVEAARAAANGGAVCQPKMGIGHYGFIAIVQDTEGNTIGLHSMQ